MEDPTRVAEPKSPADATPIPFPVGVAHMEHLGAQCEETSRELAKVLAWIQGTKDAQPLDDRAVAALVHGCTYFATLAKSLREGRAIR